MLSHKAHIRVDASFSYRFSAFPMLPTGMSKNLVATCIFFNWNIFLSVMHHKQDAQPIWSSRHNNHEHKYIIKIRHSTRQTFQYLPQQTLASIRNSLSCFTLLDSSQRRANGLVWLVLVTWSSSSKAMAPAKLQNAVVLHY